MKYILTNRHTCRYVFLYSLGSHADAAWSPVSCFLYDLLCITVPQTLHTASNWLTLGRCRGRFFWIAINTVAFLSSI